jgi:hypothetical protein
LDSQHFFSGARTWANSIFPSFKLQHLYTASKAKCHFIKVKKRVSLASGAGASQFFAGKG